VLSYVRQNQLKRSPLFCGMRKVIAVEKDIHV
jgi:hypothetical protein